MDRPFKLSELSCNLGRDWPDARGIWQSYDQSFGAFLNRNDHIVLSAINFGSNLKNLFINFYKFVHKVCIDLKLFVMP